MKALPGFLEGTGSGQQVGDLRSMRPGKMQSNASACLKHRSCPLQGGNPLVIRGREKRQRTWQKASTHVPTVPEAEGVDQELGGSLQEGRCGAGTRAPQETHQYVDEFMCLPITLYSFTLHLFECLVGGMD